MHPVDIDRFAAADGPVVIIRIAAARGSTPREAGAAMLVSARQQLGTIGGGALEWRAVLAARSMLQNAAGGREERLNLPLGPEIGQCCGGFVELSLQGATEERLAALKEERSAAEKTFPPVLIFGGGHVGLELAFALRRLPFAAQTIESRAELCGEDWPVPLRIEALPETAIRTAAPGAAAIILTHDHGLDFLIASEALRRPDLAYIGMIGSKTKRRQFERRWMDGGGDEAALARLTCPIGGSRTRDKRPGVIAALVVAELIGTLLQ